MTENTDLLARIADALERLAPEKPGAIDWQSHPAYVWQQNGARPVPVLLAPRLELLRGIDAQKARVTENVLRLAQGSAAHDMLLWGARGMGKSALLRASVLAAQQAHPGAIALVQAGAGALEGLTALFARLGAIDRNFLIFIDDLGFADNDSDGPRHLRSWLEGASKPAPRMSAWP